MVEKQQFQAGSNLRVATPIIIYHYFEECCSLTLYSKVIGTCTLPLCVRTLLDLLVISTCGSFCTRPIRNSTAACLWSAFSKTSVEWSPVAPGRNQPYFSACLKFPRISAYTSLVMITHTVWHAPYATDSLGPQLKEWAAFGMTWVWRYYNWWRRGSMLVEWLARLKTDRSGLLAG